VNDIVESTYRYIRFVKQPEGKSRNTDIYSCRTNATDTEIGIVEWYKAWRRYCYFPTTQAVYSAGCLKDIADFIGKLR
jgi:hypothetical protein